MTDTNLAEAIAEVKPETLIDLIGELGRQVYYLLDDCETSGDVGAEVHTITDEGLDKVSAILDQIDALPFEEPGYILGPGAKLEAAIKQTFIPASDARLAVSEAEARGWNNAMLTAISHVAESRNVHTPGPIFKVLNETMGKIDDARFAGLRRYQSDATEAAAKGGE